MPWGANPTRVGNWPARARRRRDADRRDDRRVRRTGEGRQDPPFRPVEREFVGRDALRRRKRQGRRPARRSRCRTPTISSTARFEVNLAEICDREECQPARLFAAGAGLSHRQIRPWRAAGRRALDAVQPRPALRDAECRRGAARIQRTGALVRHGAGAVRQRLCDEPAASSRPASSARPASAQLEMALSAADVTWTDEMQKAVDAVHQRTGNPCP